MAKQPAWDFFIAHGASGAEEAAALHRALERDARVFSRAVSLEPGEGDGVAVRALGDAGVVVLLLARDGDIDRVVGDDLTAAIERVRNDPTRRVVPVYLDAQAEANRRYGTATTQGLSLLGDGREHVVAKLREVVAGLRGVWKARPRVALVGVVEELGAHLRLAERRLSQSAEVTVTDAAAPGGVEKAAAHDLRVVFVGGRTGGGDALRTLLDGGAEGLKFTNVDFDEIPVEELAAVKPLRKRIDARDSFAAPEEAATRALEHFATWLRTWRRSDPGGDAALTPWERAYLMARQTKWRTGHHEGLREATRGRTLDRARLYVPLRAVATETEHRDASSVALHKREQPWLEAFVTHSALPSVVVEGEAGAGKTVLPSTSPAPSRRCTSASPSPTSSSMSPRSPWARRCCVFRCWWRRGD